MSFSEQQIVGLKDHQIQELVNAIRDKVEPLTGIQWTREVISKAVMEYLTDSGLRVDGKVPAKTPRTDAVQESAKSLPWGSVVVVPEGHPPHDPWELARHLEEDIRRLRGQLENCVQHLEGVSRRHHSEQGKHAECIDSANKTLYETFNKD